MKKKPTKKSTKKPKKRKRRPKLSAKALRLKDLSSKAKRDLNSTEALKKAYGEEKFWELGVKCCKKLHDFLNDKIELSQEQMVYMKGVIFHNSMDSFYFFAKYVLGFDKLLPSVHKQWCDKIQKDMWKFKNIMRMFPRKLFKTTIFGEALPLWIWAMGGKDIRFQYRSATKTLLDEVASHVKTYIDPVVPTVYQFVFEVRLDLNPKVKNTDHIYNIDGKKATKGYSIVFATAGSRVTGTHPHWITVDDPCDEEDRSSAIIRQRKIDWFPTLVPLIDTHLILEKDSPWYGKFIEHKIYIGTHWHLDDLPSWIRSRNHELDERDRFDIDVRGGLNEEGEAEFPEMLSKEKLERLRLEVGNDELWSCQYLNDPTYKTLRVFNEDKLHFSPIDAWMVHTKTGWKYQGTIHCYFDPAKGKLEGDWPAVIWVNKIYKEEGGETVPYLMIIDAINEKIDIEDLVYVIAEKNKMYRCRSMKYEEYGVGLIGKGLRDAHKSVGWPSIDINNIKDIRKAIGGTKKKEIRIKSLPVYLYAGNVLFRLDRETAYPEMMRQILLYGAYKYDDYPDVVEMAVADSLIYESDFMEYIKEKAEGGAKILTPIENTMMYPLQRDFIAKTKNTLAESKEKGGISVRQYNYLSKLQRANSQDEVTKVLEDIPGGMRSAEFNEKVEEIMDKLNIRLGIS